MNKLSFSSHFAIISLPLHTMKRTLYVFLFMLLLTACGGCRDGDRLLNDAGKIVEEFPDSALHMLERYDTAGIGKAERADYHYVHCNWGWNGENNGYFINEAFRQKYDEEEDILELSPFDITWGFCLFYDTYPNVQ